MSKIILIDDNQSNLREIYGASFVDLEEYEDCLFHVEQLNENSDFSFLDDAACVLLHDSLEDYVDGKYVSGSRKAKELIWNKIKDKIPFVKFSDGHSIIGDWNPSEPNVVRSIKKSEFYRNLKEFLDAYRESSHIDLRLIAYGSDYEKRELVVLLQKVFDELKNVNDKEILTFSLVDTDLLERFFKKVKHVSSLTYEKLCDSINAGKLTVGKFKAYINSLASHAIKYTALVPKQNILLLGNELSQERMSGMNNVTFKPLNTFQLGEKGEKEMFDNISSCIPSNVDAIIIDVDSTKTPDACLSYALAIRLSLHEKKEAALAPIIFMSSLTPDIFKNSPYSTLLQTKGISFETPLYTPTAIELIEPLSAKDYRPFFLDLIKVKPNSTEGRHSIANQWGADVLSRIVLGTETDNALIKQARQSLYFKYVLALTLSEDAVLSLLSTGGSTSEETGRLTAINAVGKKILLIDDEADKGWSDVLKQMLNGSSFKTIKEHAADFSSLSEESQDEIRFGNYDLIFLDLRMNGTQEEGKVRPEDFSGMKILKSIKELNKGTQVIMFTASNKAWNMKALMDAGADGYYIKESPEFAFSNSYSVSNANELSHCITRCLNNGYLRDVYLKVKRIKELIRESSLYGERTEEILSSIDIAYDLLAKSDNRNEYRAYSYLQLFLAIEEYVKLPTVIDSSDTGLYLYNGEMRYRILKDKVATKSGVSYDSKISMDKGHYCIKSGKYTNRFFDTNFLVSAVLIYKFSHENSAALGWTKICNARNEIAHPKRSNVSVGDFDRILNFMLYFFNPKNNKWREPNQAFPDIKLEDQLKMLQDKFR